MGGLEPLIKQMLSPNVEVQCNAVGCMTNIATHEDNKSKIARSGALTPLIRLAMSKDMRVQRNATGALLNMTHSYENRKELVSAGAIPVLVNLLGSADPDVQYYCTTALSNIAVDLDNRKVLAAQQPMLVNYLIKLMSSSSSRVQCQAALALRNLASDLSYQLEVIEKGGLDPLLSLLHSSHAPLVMAAVACARNISIHPLNESAVIKAGFLNPLVALLDKVDNQEVQCHTVSTLRNLAASSEKNKLEILEAGAVEKCVQLIEHAPVSVQSEITAFIAVLALGDGMKSILLSMGIASVLIPLTKVKSVEVQGNAAAALGNLSSKVGDYGPFLKNWTEPAGGIEGFLVTFLESGDCTFEHIAVWMIVQLLESQDERLVSLLKHSKQIVDRLDQLAREDVSTVLGSDDPDAASKLAVPTLANKAYSIVKP